MNEKCPYGEIKPVYDDKNRVVGHTTKNHVYKWTTLKTTGGTIVVQVCKKCGAHKLPQL